MKNLFMPVCLLLLLAGSAGASFEYNAQSPRAKGMGSAFVAVADDYYAGLVNPAGLALADKIGVSFSYAMPYIGFDEDFRLSSFFASLLYPHVRLGSFNLYYSRFALSELYHENVYALNYGVSINNFWKKLAFKFYSGLGLKLMQRAYTLDDRSVNDPVFRDGTSSTAFGIDLGILLSSFKSGSENYYSIGLSVRNLNEPDAGFTGEDPVYRQYLAGFAYNIVDLKLFRGTLLTPAAQLSYSNGNSVIMLGLEMWVYRKLLGIRAGWNSNELSAGLSFNYRFAHKYEVGFDYSFIMARQMVENYGTHNFALSFKFAGPGL